MKFSNPDARARPRVRTLVRIAIVLAAACASACTTIGYYGQAVRGHLALMHARKPLATLIADEKVPATLRERLSVLADARRFAVDELALPDNDSYTSYADLGRDYVVWNVVATPALSLEPIPSCFPVSGCLSYRGFFDEAAARRHAAALAADGHDTYVGGVAAYSTLGWFDDPLVSPMFRYPDPVVVGIVFHELVHQRLYFPGDSAFNEALASAVADAGVRAYLTATDPLAVPDYERRRARRRAFVALVLETREALRAVYEGAGSEKEKHAAKARILERTRRRYAQLDAVRGGDAGYDRFFDEGLNNARLASVATYEALVPAFTAILERLDYDFRTFFDQMAALERMTPTQRAACVRDLAASEDTDCLPEGMRRAS